MPRIAIWRMDVESFRLRCLSIMLLSLSISSITFPIKNSTMSVLPNAAALNKGVSPKLFLWPSWLLSNFNKIRAISISPVAAASWSGVFPLIFEPPSLSHPLHLPCFIINSNNSSFLLKTAIWSAVSLVTVREESRYALSFSM